jgi:hypothetical protein
MTALQRSLVVTAAAVTLSSMLVGSGIGPASAAAPPTAQLIGGTDVTSTLSRDLDVRVKNTGVPGGNTSYVDAIVVVPHVPAGGTQPLLSITSGSANGWSTQPYGNGGLLLTAPPPPTANLTAPLAPGKFVDISVTAQAAGVAADAPVSWDVETSSDEGRTFTQSGVANGGTLQSYVRVLVNNAPHIDFLTTTHNVTAGQNNLTVTQNVTNYGTAPLDVTPFISGSGGDAVTGTPAATTVLPQQTVAVTTPVGFGSVGTARQLLCGFTASGAASSRQSTAPYDVQTPVSLSYNGTMPLAPKAASSSSTQTFTLTVDKSGDPGVTLAAPTALSLTDSVASAHTFSAPLSAPTTIGAGSASTALAFGPVTVPGNPLTGDWDGVYSPLITVRGTDANGAPVASTVSVSDVFALSSLAPVAQPTLSTPNHAAQAGDSRNSSLATRPYTAKNGDPLTFSGPIYTRANTTTTSSTAKVTCFIDSLQGSTVIDEQSVACSNSAGQLTGSASVTFPARSDGATLKVVTADIAGNTATTTSNIIVVDNTPPTLGFALTGCGWPVPWTCIDTQNIRIQLSEPVTGAFNVSNFAVTVNGSEVPVTRLHFYGSTSVFSDVLALNLGTAIGPDDIPVVRYLPSSPAPAADAAANQMTVLTRVDGQDQIPAPLPQLDKVTGKAAYQGDGAFYTNVPSTSYTLSNTASGDTVTIYAETNGIDGLQPNADTVLCKVTPTASTGSCSDPSSALPDDGRYRLYLQAVDPSGNTSVDSSGNQWAPATEVLDRVAPALSAFTADSGGVTVQVSEIVSGLGRDFADDWTVNNGQTTYVVGSVAAPDETHRRLSVSSNTWSGVATSVSYRFRGSDPTQRYSDLAGNYLSDQSLPLGG